jgi:hypothetical protein
MVEAVVVLENMKGAKYHIWEARFRRLEGRLRGAAWERAAAGDLLRRIGEKEKAQRQYWVAAKYLIKAARKFKRTDDSSVLFAISELKEAVDYMEKIREIGIRTECMDKSGDRNT